MRIFSRGAHGRDNVAVGAGCFARDFCRGAVYLLCAAVKAIMGELEPVGAEAVRFDHVRAGRDIAARDVEHVGSAGDAPEFRALARFEAFLVEKRSPRAVGHEHGAGFDGFDNGFHVAPRFKI